MVREAATKALPTLELKKSFFLSGHPPPLSGQAIKKNIPFLCGFSNESDQKLYDSPLNWFIRYEFKSTIVLDIKYNTKNIFFYFSIYSIWTNSYLKIVLFLIWWPKFVQYVASIVPFFMYKINFKVNFCHFMHIISVNSRTLFVYR